MPAPQKPVRPAARFAPQRRGQRVQQVGTEMVFGIISKVLCLKFSYSVYHFWCHSCYTEIQRNDNTKNATSLQGKECVVMEETMRIETDEIRDNLKYLALLARDYRGAPG